MDLQKTLSTVLTPVELNVMPRSYDRVGDILITAVPETLVHKKGAIGEVLLALHPSIKVVANRRGMHRGEYRTRELEVIAGEQRLETLQKESGVRLHLDLEKAYYSVRLSGERLKIARQVAPGEDVAVLCSGIGPFPLVIAAHSKARKVVGLEKNPAAHALALKNLEANRKINNVTFIHTDATLVDNEYKTAFDRVISILPVAHETMLPSGTDMIKPGGVLHHYAMVKDGDTESICDSIRSSFFRHRKIIEEITTRRCGHCARDLDRTCFTVTTKKS